MIQLKTFISGAFLSLSLCLPTYAQSSYKGFSQLEFDRPVAKIEPPKRPSHEQVKEILELDVDANKQAAKALEPKKVTKVVTVQSQVEANKLDSTARASLEHKTSIQGERRVTAAKIPGAYEWAKPDFGASHFLVPRLKGPVVDKANPQSISSGRFWRSANIACHEVVEKEALCQKSLSLKEIMNRYSGSDDFYDAQCQQSCNSSAETAVLVSFAVKSVKDGEFKISEANGECRYQISSKASPPTWMMLEGERGVCACLPKSCLR